MQNFDVQHNVACKHSAIGRVANVFSFVTTGRHVVLCFQRFVQHLDQMLKKLSTRSATFFIHSYTISLNILNVFTMKRITLQMR